MKPAMASVRTVVPCSRSLNTRSSRPCQKTGWFVVDSLSVSERKEGIRRYPIPKLQRQARLYGNFSFILLIRQRLRRGIGHDENVKLVNMEWLLTQPETVFLTVTARWSTAR